MAVAVAACAFVFATSAGADPYISMGDSTSTGDMYPGLLYGGYTGHQGFDQTLGADEHISLGQGGQVLAGLKVEQLPAALAAINDSDDTKAVTIGIGGNDGLGNDEQCFGSEAGCPAWQASYLDMVAQVRTALDNDPGEEFFGLLSYYNPFRWDGSGISQEDQDRIDLKLLGTNLIADQCPADAGIGINDIIRKAGSEYGAVVADPYDAFLDADGTFLADSIHANAAGNEAIADAFLDPVLPIDCNPPPEPTCETDPSLCPPQPTCETDASLCPDQVAPQTRIVSMKRRGRHAVTFRFRSSERGGFLCSLDRRKFVRCSSPRTFRGLRRGRHLFRVKAVDAAGNVDRTPARRAFRIKR
ncbi:MAG: SGNH/GDSL hydrolase family protein [Solirubrobacterales bacterium]|nr:SGNH/GDSL hydrolase family protein [Solirubrobacterales bacterium]